MFQKPLDLVTITPPPVDIRAKRAASFAEEGEPRNRYSLPQSLESSSPVGYRTRVALSIEEGKATMQLLALERPAAFVETTQPVTDHELFEESALGVLTARQSTNFKGQRQTSLGPQKSAKVAELLRRMAGWEPILDGAEYTHIVLARPYRTPFTMLLTFIGHKRATNLLGVLNRAVRKQVLYEDDIPTIGYLQQLHLGIFVDQLERAVVIASGGRRMTNIVQVPFVGEPRQANRAAISQLEALAGLSARDRAAGWRIGFVAQVGEVSAASRPTIEQDTYRKIGANILAFRSERIQPGVNAEEKAPPQYQARQEMDVPDELTVQAGRAAYNAFCHWTQVERENAKNLLLLERIDVLTDNGKERLREIREHLGHVTDQLIDGLPKWADLATGKALSRNAARGKKAFALAGQRIYIGGLDRRHVATAGVPWRLAVRAFGAAAARGALVSELAGVIGLPDDCDLLAGVCLMAGPVNQNDIGKSFYGSKDLLQSAFPEANPTSLLVWTMKAKTVADPIGNEEQLLNAKRKGALVDLRMGPHECIQVRRGELLEPFRNPGSGKPSADRAFADVGNFVTDPSGREIPGNRGTAWPADKAGSAVWK
ncbi:MAG: hypothetical protein ACJAYU_000437 [Bradymonadia bacterium]|jgi:hypothetical protein